MYPKRYLAWVAVELPDAGPVGRELALACERFRDGPFGQPANATTSLAFCVAAVLIAAGRTPGRPRPTGARWWFAALVFAVGAGSWVQHGPHPAWQAYAHDLPLATLLGFVAADAAADLTGRRRPRYGWLLTPVAMVPVVAIGPVASSLTQGVLGAVAIGLNLLRAKARPRLRRVLLPALAVLAAGALLGSLTDRTALCAPDRLWQGHAAWHVLAATAVWLLAPAIGERDRPADRLRGRSGWLRGRPAERRLAPEAESA
ncbi:MAG TPA: hypothetical protein VIL37_16170 [Natronosporangium sp.]